MDARTYDVVVLGAGASGLSFLCHLGAIGAGRRLRVAVVDDDRDGADRHWAFWTAQPEIVEPAVVRTYHRICTDTLGRHQRHALEPYRYCVVSRSGLRDLARSSLPRATWLRGRALAPRPGSPASVRLDDGTVLRAPLVLDGRGRPETPAHAPATGPLLHLQFSGARVRTTRRTFDPRTATLFDFRTPQCGEARFVYVLPVSPHEAFVELTCFTARRAPLTPASATRTLRSYLLETTGHGAHCLHLREHGGYPLGGCETASPGPGVVELGTRAGLLKPSTGYAFGRIQRDAARLATSVAHGGPLTHEPHKRRFSWLDTVFLSAVADDPCVLEHAFDALLHGDDAAAGLLRFLDEDSALGQDVRLVSRLPWRPFVAAVGSRKTWSMRG